LLRHEMRARFPEYISGTPTIRAEGRSGSA
jgi:hypothetical protein